MDKADIKIEETLCRLQSMGLKPADCSLLMAVIIEYATGNFYRSLGFPPTFIDTQDRFTKYILSRFPHIPNLQIMEILELAEIEKMWFSDMKMINGEN